LRFSVLAGEAVHHLRSCLDHIVWHFSSSDARLKHCNVIEFPIFEIKPDPLDKKEVKRYERKVQGITNVKVLNLIEQTQPYNAGTDPADDSLLIVHNMDRFDKHRELVIVDCSAEITFPPTMDDLWRKAELYSQGKLTQSDRPAFGQALKDYAKVTPGVAFRQFGKRKTYPVILGLSELWRAISEVAAIFATQV
jgi:hypothetical protein